MALHPSFPFYNSFVCPIYPLPLEKASLIRLDVGRCVIPKRVRISHSLEIRVPGPRGIVRYMCGCLPFNGLAFSRPFLLISQYLYKRGLLYDVIEQIHVNALECAVQLLVTCAATATRCQIHENESSTLSPTSRFYSLMMSRSYRCFHDLCSSQRSV
jgi:hypothetical protein